MQFKDIVLTINLNSLTVKFNDDEILPSKVLIEWVRGTPNNTEPLNIYRH